MHDKWNCVVKSPFQILRYVCLLLDFHHAVGKLSAVVFGFKIEQHAVGRYRADPGRGTDLSLIIYLDLRQ